MKADNDDFGEELAQLQRSYVNGLSDKMTAIVDLWSAVNGANRREPDLVALYTLLHNLRGSGTLFGYDRISERAAPLERLIADLKNSGRTASTEEKRNGQQWLLHLQDAVHDARSTKITAALDDIESLDILSRVKRVLVVDDDQDIRNWITEFLRQSYRVTEAGDGEEGLRKAMETFPDLIISDVVMPNMDGYRLCHAIKSNPQLNRIPIILLTAESSEEHKVAGLEFGADDYLTKPFNMRELLARVKSLIKLKHAQSQMIHSAKMAALGQLVAGAAHELNNPLSFLMGNLSLLEGLIDDLRTVTELYERHATLPVDGLEEVNRLKAKIDYANLAPEIEQSLDSCMQGALRIKNIVSALKNFSNLDHEEWQEVDIHDCLETSLMLLPSRDQNPIVMDRQYGQLPKLGCAVGQMNQVFMHLLLNAVQAIDAQNEHGGRRAGQVGITTEWVPTGDAQNPNVVRITIRDDGIGIAPGIRDKIFNPFFTTHSVGAGAGLGLALCHSIVTHHHGRLYFESVEGQGTTFFVEIPAEDQEEE